MDFVDTAKQYLKAWVAFIIFVLARKCVHHALKKVSNVELNKHLDALRRDYIEEKGFNVKGMWEFER